MRKKEEIKTGFLLYQFIVLKQSNIFNVLYLIIISYINI